MNISKFIPQDPFGPDCCFHPQSIVISNSGWYLGAAAHLTTWRWPVLQPSFPRTYGNCCTYYTYNAGYLTWTGIAQSIKWPSSFWIVVFRFPVGTNFYFVTPTISLLNANQPPIGWRPEVKCRCAKLIFHPVWYKGLLFAEIYSFAAVRLQYVVCVSTLYPPGNRRTRT
jgi:hypothetical protein